MKKRIFCKVLFGALLCTIAIAVLFKIHYMAEEKSRENVIRDMVSTICVTPANVSNDLAAFLEGRIEQCKPHFTESGLTRAVANRYIAELSLWASDNNHDLNLQDIQITRENESNSDENHTLTYRFTAILAISGTTQTMEYTADVILMKDDEAWKINYFKPTAMSIS